MEKLQQLKKVLVELAFDADYKTYEFLAKINSDIDAQIGKIKINKQYQFVLNGEVKRINAPNLLKALSEISKAYPDTKTSDYRSIFIQEVI